MATEETTITELELAEEVLADMVIPVDTSTDTKSVSLKQLRAWLGSSLPTGFILPAVGRIDDERFSLLDGKTLSKQGTYGAFCAKVEEQVQASNWFACTEEEYNADLLAYGQCGKFVIGTDYVRIPTITRFIGATITLSEIGKTYKESLPNIKGSLTRGGTGEVIHSSAIASGAFELKSTQNSKVNYTGDGGNAELYFNASRSSSTYQDNAKVQPDHTKYPYYMVVSTEGQTAKVEIDINKFYEDLNLKANSDLSNVASVAQSFKTASVSWGVPDYDSGIAYAYNTWVQAPFDCYVKMGNGGGSNLTTYLYTNTTNSDTGRKTLGYIYGYACVFGAFIPKGLWFKGVTTSSAPTEHIYYPLKGVN